MSVLNRNSAINELKVHYKERRLIPFLGAGLSIPLGLPSWQELMGWMATKLGFESELFLLHGNFQQLAEYTKVTSRRTWKSLLNKMTRDFDSVQAIANRKKSPIHKALSSLDFKTIYTTNYDSHIEESIRDTGRKCVTLSSLADFLENREPNITEVIKFHGTLEDPETIILTESRYFDRMLLEEAVDQRLRADILSNSFLFIGYGFKDPNIRYIWYKIHKLREQQRIDIQYNLRPSYFVAFGSNPVQPKLLETWNINVITLDPTAKEKEISELLLSLKKI